MTFYFKRGVLTTNKENFYLMKIRYTDKILINRYMEEFFMKCLPICRYHLEFEQKEKRGKKNVRNTPFTNFEIMSI